jgi:hypothetical protein
MAYLPNSAVTANNYKKRAIMVDRRLTGKFTSMLKRLCQFHPNLKTAIPEVIQKRLTYTLATR